MVGAAVAVVRVVVVRPGVLVLLPEGGGGVGGAESLPLLLGLLKDPAVRQSTQPAEELTVHLSPALLLPVEGTLLLALFAGLRGAMLLLRVGAALTLGPDEGSDDVTVLTGLWRPKLFHILGTLLTDRVCFTLLLELRAAECTLDDGVGDATLLAELLPLGQLLEGVPLGTLGAGVQGGGGHPSDR